MDKIKCYMLCRNREVIIKKVKPDREHYFRDGLYIVTRDRVNNSVINGEMGDPEIIFFQDDALGLSLKKPIEEEPETGTETGTDADKRKKKVEDAEITFLDEILIENLIKQTSGTTYDFRKFFAYFEGLKKPQNIITILLFGGVAYGLLSQFINI